MKRLFIVLALALGLSACSSSPESADSAGTPFATSSTISRQLATDVFPDVTLTPWSTETEQSSRSIAKPVVINLWASWCTNCAHEMPLIADSPYAKNVVAINVGDLAITDAGQATANALVASTKNTFPIFIDKNDALLKELGVNGLPVTFAVDASNHIVDVEFGELTQASLARLVKSSGAS